MVMILIGRRSASQAGSTIPYHLRACDPCSGLVGLVTVTNAYQPRDLGRNLPWETFTNHYRRTEDITHSGRDYVLCWVIMDYDVDAMTGTCMM